MAIYRLKRGLNRKLKLDGYDNSKEKYDIEIKNDGIEVCAKNGETLLEVDASRRSKIYVYTFDDRIAVEKYYKDLNRTNVMVFQGNEMIKDATFNGEVAEVIGGGQDIYFKRFHHYSGNRFYYTICREDGKALFEPWQVIKHEYHDDDKKDRFYCEDYYELSKEEFLEEDDEEYANNLAEIAVYYADGYQVFSQSYVEEERRQRKETNAYDNQMLMGAAVSAVDPLVGSAIMLSSQIAKKKDEECEKSQTQQEDESSFGME